MKKHMIEEPNEQLSRVEIVTTMAKSETLRVALGKFGVSGMTVFAAQGCGVQLGSQEYEVTKAEAPRLLPKQVIMFVLPSAQLDPFLDFVEKELYTGHIGDGKIFISPVTNAIRIRTGEEGTDAVQEGKAY